MRLKVVCTEGTAYGTTVTDVDTGQPIEGVVGVTWSVRAGGFARAVLELEGVEVEVLGETITVGS